MTSNQEVTIRLVSCAVGVPDFTGVEDICRLTVGQSIMPSAHCSPNCLACLVWRETGAVRNARPSRGQAAFHPEEDAVGKDGEALPPENDECLSGIRSPHTAAFYFNGRARIQKVSARRGFYRFARRPGACR